MLAMEFPIAYFQSKKCELHKLWVQIASEKGVQTFVKKEKLLVKL